MAAVDRDSRSSNSESLKEIHPPAGSSSGHSGTSHVKKEDKSSDVRYGSILEKDRESVFSNEDARRGDRDSHDD